MAASVEKVSVAIGREELDWLRERAQRESSSLSAVMTQALRQSRELEARRARQNLAWWEFLEWATEGEGLAPEALEAARKELEDK